MRVKYTTVETRSALPYFLRVWWCCTSPMAVLFAGRIMWEKTVWTWSRGPQMVGFSMMHIHPMIAIVGMLGCLAVMLWLLPAIPYAIARRRAIGVTDVAMIACSLFVAAAVVIPDNFFA
jgi:hypothetical protein